MKTALLISVCFLFFTCQSKGDQEKIKKLEYELAKQQYNSGKTDSLKQSSEIDFPNETQATKPTAIQPQSQEEIVLEIRKEFQRINKLNLTKKEYEWEGNGCGEFTITYFLENGLIVKVVEKGWIGDGSWIKEYYYQNKEFIFSYEVFYPDYSDKMEYRTYVKNNQTIKYMENQKVLPCETCSFNALSQEYKILEAYSTKDFSNALCNY
ncbi:MAG: hypothetical protein H3C39_09625 [Flavobacteriia bacterium]|nr:hypothetical protein [Flavobacteriia bacterium]